MLALSYWIPLIPSLFLTQSTPLEPHFQALPGWKYWQYERLRVEVKRERAKKGSECFRNALWRYRSDDFERPVSEKDPSHNCPVKHCSSLVSPDMLLSFSGLLGYFIFYRDFGLVYCFCMWLFFLSFFSIYFYSIWQIPFKQCLLQNTLLYIRKVYSFLTYLGTDS